MRTLLVALVAMLVVLPPYLVSQHFLIWALDGGVFAYAGQQWLQGQLLYGEVWDQKPPLIFMMNAIGLALGRGHSLGLVLFAALQIGLFSALFMRLLRNLNWWAQIAGLASALLWVVKLEALNTVGCFTLVPHLLILSAWVRDEEENDWGKRALLAGVCAGWLFLGRPNQAASAMAYLAVVLLVSRGSRRWLALSRFALGMTGVVASVVFLVAMRGTLDGMWEGSIGYNLRYVAATSFWSKATFVLFGLENVGSTGLLGLGLAAAGWGLLGLARRMGLGAGTPRPPLVLAASVVLLIELAQGAISGRFYSHYLTAVLPPCAVLVAWGLSCLEGQWKHASRWIAASVVMVLCLAVGASAWRTSKLKPAEPAVAARISGRLAPDAYTYIWATNRSSLPFLLGRPSASRFFSAVLVTHSERIYKDLVPQLLTDIEANQPAMIADCAPPDLHYFFRDSERHLGITLERSNWETAEIRSRIDAISQNYEYGSTEVAARCVIYWRR